MSWHLKSLYAGAALVGLGTLLLIGGQPVLVAVNASTEHREAVETGVNYLGWATLGLGFLTLASSHYFRLRESRRADRAEAREIHDRRRRPDDIS
jgi:hypothetical protein